MSQIKELDGAPCTYCGSTNSSQVVPDHHPFSPWECGECGAVFGTSRTSTQLLKDWEHGPTDKEEVGNFEDDICYRCKRELEDDDSRIITDKGQICDDCVLAVEDPHVG